MGVFSFAFLMNCLIIEVAMLSRDGLKSFIFIDFVMSITMMIDLIVCTISTFFSDD